MDFGKLQADVIKNTYKHIDNKAARDYTVYGNIAINTKDIYLSLIKMLQFI